MESCDSEVDHFRVKASSLRAQIEKLQNEVKEVLDERRAQAENTKNSVIIVYYDSKNGAVFQPCKTYDAAEQYVTYLIAENWDGLAWKPIISPRDGYDHYLGQWTDGGDEYMSILELNFYEIP